ncbi:MAG: hypothetical protein DRQ78_11660 [Epsilonproteobacteria bacterium]|nr:MAG: hypothetical protein DRQ78_11660 [Campylobacterota bacterium]
MKNIIIIYLISLTYLIATPKEKQLVSPAMAIELLETIKKDAIVLGNGKIEVHTFIDPLCKMSQRYLALLYKRNYEIFSKYTIYLYMHEIKSKQSKQHILSIMDAKSPERMLNTIMLDKDMSQVTSRYIMENRRTFEKIANVAKKIGVNKRPYIMINGKVK